MFFINLKILEKLKIFFLQIFHIIFKNLLEFFSLIAKASDITSIKLIFEGKLHLIERIFWLFMVIGSITASYILIINQIYRLYNNPTVMSLDRDYRSWNGTLPGLTICYHDHMDLVKADILIKEKWNISETDNDYNYFMEFLYAVINATAYNYEDLATYSEDERLEDIDLYEIVKSINRPYHQKLMTFHHKNKVQVLELMTERGMCYTVNAPMSKMLNENNKNVKVIEKPIICQYGRQQCFIKLDIFESTGTIEVHSPYEISASDAGVGAIELTKLDEVIATYKVLETFASENLRRLTAKQRKCVFYNEPTSGLSIYSKTLCLARCRAIMALEMCNCVPFFYPFVEGPKCNVAGFECLLDFKWPIWALHICKCPSTCNEHIYSMHSLKRSSWGVLSSDENKVTSSFRWQIIPPKVRMRRDVVFGFEDLLVSVGGAIGLFVGASFLTLLKVGLVSLQWLTNMYIDIITNIKSYYTKLFVKGRKIIKNKNKNKILYKTKQKTGHQNLRSY